MKKIKVLAVAAMFALTTIPTIANAKTDNNQQETPVNTQENKYRASLLVNRLIEIDKMEKSGMDASTKKQIRKEVKSIDKELKRLSSGGGVYISLGAIIIILLLLIILL